MLFSLNLKRQSTKKNQTAGESDLKTIKCRQIVQKIKKRKKTKNM